ncbi:LamG domain-containing protein [Pyxidicoccus sp. MSG2]|uniref:LamG domain-containing protein n=1 Tax=Pyxidicoccus sp. MSG2 TaxID=2996790 RepID=UPI00226E4A80|nr:LamG-like jellyroll fold domain-containing protein [Pyxidicoccus sp. MSG2]MCY1022934.1 laminin G [Pyxidicoccus sp. MSG2]
MRPMYQYGAADVRYGQRIQLGTSSPIDLSGSASYSIGFWLRPRAPAYDGYLVMSGMSYYIGLHGMQLTLSIPGMNTPQRSELELLPDQWQYVLLVFESTGANAGSYALSVNGTPLIEGSISRVTASSGLFTLGTTTDAQFCNVAFWSAALPEGERQPVWDVPQPGSTLAACYSFSDGSTGDVSGHNRGAATFLEGAQVVMLAPAMRLVNAAVQPSPRDALAVVANGAPFSVQAWFNAHAPSDFQAASRTVFACKDPNNGYGFTMGLEWNGTGFNLQLSLSSAGSGEGWGHNLQLAPGDWHHLAATYDGTTLSIYLDGVIDMNIPCTFPSLAAPVWLFGASPDASVAGGAAYDFQGHLQAAGLWSRALSASEVQQYMASDPSDAEGCVAYYAWNGAILANQVTGNPPVLLNTAMPSIVVTPPAASTPPPGVSNTLVTAVQPSYRNQPSARWAAEEVPYPAQSPISRDQVDSILAAYEPVLAAVPGAMKDRLRSLFRNNLYLGLARANGPSGMPVGTIAGKVVGSEYVFYHHTAQGAVECGRMELAVDTECIGWVISVAATSICLLLSVVGLGFSASKAVSALRPLISESTALLKSVGDAAKGTTDASTVIRVIKALYIGGTLGKVFGAMLTGSWYTIALNCAMLILMVAGLFTTGGAYLAVVLAQLALNLVTLIVLIAQKPSNCC